MGADANAADILQSYFERSASVVHSAFLRVEKTYVNPLIGRVSRSFETRPILSAFLAVFFALAFLPTLSFIGFSIFTFGFLTFLALAGSSLASILVIGLAGFVLVCTLAVLFLFALLFSSSALAVFLSLRLVTLVRTDGPRTGISEWTKETKARLVQDGPATSLIQPDVATAKSDGDDDDSDSNVSVGSTVVVNGATDSGVSGNDSPVLVKEEPE